MIDHTGIGVEDMGRSATFYDAALGALGFRRAMQLPRRRAQTGSDTASNTRSSGSTATTPIPSGSTRRSPPGAAPR